MRCWKYILLLSVLPTLSLFGQKKTSYRNPLEKIKTFGSTGRDTTVVLGYFLIPGSVEVRLDSVLVPADDYVIDYRTGRFSFVCLPDSGHAVRIRYSRMPSNLRLSYRHWTPSDTASTEKQDRPPSVYRQPEAARTVDEFGAALERSGSIFRGVSVGTNQGMRLQSGLRLQVSGRVARNVEVTASLTDQSTPIQPEGNTQTLQEIDKVFVNIRAPGVGVTMGDYVFESRGTRFGRYTKKLQGGMGTVETGFGSFTAAAAASKGNFTTNHFLGQEGNQGPYQLTGVQGRREIIVLAGTERVYVDGEPMTRGEDNDYVVEYGNGQITFTRKRLITEDSRITVDFEYSDQKFQKAVYGATGEVRLWEDRVTFRTSFLRESDDKEQPLDMVLTDSLRQILERAGDDPDSAVTTGAVYMGEGKGAYSRADSAGVLYYRYVGLEKGDYTVRFSYVGHGEGDYSFQGYGIYRYEGPGRGSYLPVAYLPVASSHQTVSLASSVDLGRGFSVEGELGISDRDLNTYSARDDGDNVDVAYSGGLRLDRQPIRILGKGLGELGFEATLHHVGERFRTVGRTTEVEHGRKWGVAEGRYWGEDVLSLEGAYQPFEAWRIEGEWGDFRREDFRSSRKRLSTALEGEGLPSLRYQAELLESERGTTDGTWLRHDGSLEYSFWGLTPSLRYMGEHRKEEEPDSAQTGFKYDEWAGGIGFQKGVFSGRLEESVRDDRTYSEGRLERNSLARTDRMTLDVRLKNGVSSSLMFTHRNRDYTDPAEEDQVADLADMTLRIAPGKRFFDGTLSYRFSSTQVSEMVTDTITVGEGLGSYRYDEDLDELVPDADGDILIRNIQTGTFLPVNDLKVGGDIRLDGRRLGAKRIGIWSLLEAMRTRTLVRIERRDRERGFWSVNRSAFGPSWGGDSTTVTGVVSLFQDVEISPSGSSLNVRFRLRSDDSENNQHLHQGLVRHVDERGVRVKGNPMKRLGLLLEYENRDEVKEYNARPLSNRDIRLHSWTADVSYRPRQQVEIALKTRIRSARNRAPAPVTEAFSVFLLPRFSYAFRGRGHLRAEAEFGNVRATPDEVTLPYEMLGGDQPGTTFRWSVLMSYRISGHVQATLNYRGRREPWRKRLYQTGQVEVRAFF